MHAARQRLAGAKAVGVTIARIDTHEVVTVAREHLVMPLTCDIGRRERDEALADGVATLLILSTLFWFYPIFNTITTAFGKLPDIVTRRPNFHARPGS